MQFEANCAYSRTSKSWLGLKVQQYRTLILHPCPSCIALQLTPVAKLEPVQVAGVTIQNVSLHNAGHLRDMQLAPGDVVAVERAGDVIPQVCGAVVCLRCGVWEAG